MEYQWAIRRIFKHKLNKLALKLNAINSSHIQGVAFNITNYDSRKYDPSYGQIFRDPYADFPNVEPYKGEIEALSSEILEMFSAFDTTEILKMCIFSYLVHKRKIMLAKDDFSWLLS